MLSISQNLPRTFLLAAEIRGGYLGLLPIVQELHWAVPGSCKHSSSWKRKKKRERKRNKTNPHTSKPEQPSLKKTGLHLPPASVQEHARLRCSLAPHVCRHWAPCHTLEIKAGRCKETAVLPGKCTAAQLLPVHGDPLH